MTSAPDHAARPRPTLRKIGSLTLVEVLAQSQIADVFRAVDTAAGCEVMVKVGHPGATELRPWQPLDQPSDLGNSHVIKDAFCSNSGQPVVVYEMPTGQSVEKRFSSFDGNYRWIAQFVRESAVALDQLHSAGMTHGDISPRTLHIGEHDQAILTEPGMGLAPSAYRSDGGASLQPGQSGKDPAEVRERKFKLDQRADIFALGCVLYYLLSGQAPSEQHAALLSDPGGDHDDVPPIDRVAPEAPTELRAICSQSLSSDPVHRYLRASTLVRDLDAYLVGKRSHRSVKLAFVAVGVLMIGLFGLWGTVGGGDARIVELNMLCQRAGAESTESLEGAQSALTVGDTFCLQVKLSKAAHVSVLRLGPEGHVDLLAASSAAGRSSIDYQLPTADDSGNSWWPASRGGSFVILVVSHLHSQLPDGFVEGVVAGVGPPPRSYSAISWYGRSFSSRTQPEVFKPLGSESRYVHWSSFEQYAQAIMRDLSSEASDAAVGIMYVIGA